MTLIILLVILLTHLVLFDFTVYSCGWVMTHNDTIWCHPEVDWFPFEPGSSQGSFLYVVHLTKRIEKLDRVE